MGLSGIGFKELLLILVIVLIIFGAKRLKTLGSDLGGAMKSFRKAMDQDDDKESSKPKHIEADAPDAEFAEQKDKTRQDK